MAPAGKYDLRQAGRRPPNPSGTPIAVFYNIIPARAEAMPFGNMGGSHIYPAAVPQGKFVSMRPTAKSQPVAASALQILLNTERRRRG
eukprot:scaffold625_cov420-Prasinococcus_capsulatus_cf.AAC.44